MDKVVVCSCFVYRGENPVRKFFNGINQQCFSGTWKKMETREPDCKHLIKFLRFGSFMGANKTYIPKFFQNVVEECALIRQHNKEDK